MAKHLRPVPAVLSAVSAFVVFATLLSRRMFPVRVGGRSMQPVLQPGDLLVVDRRAGVTRGAIVVAQLPDGVEAVKRVAALGGDTHRGTEIPHGSVFLVGDNASESTDSRAFGPVPLEAIEGVAKAIYLPLHRWRIL